MGIKALGHGQALAALVSQLGAQFADVPLVLGLADEHAVKASDDAVHVVSEVCGVCVADLHSGLMGVVSHLGQGGALAAHQLDQDAHQGYEYRTHG